MVWPNRYRGTFFFCQEKVAIQASSNYLQQGATSLFCKPQRRALRPITAGGPMASSLQDFLSQRLIILVEGTHV
jgi:hypothetical protein